MKDKDTLYYAREVIEGAAPQYVRFRAQANRHFWLGKDKVNRFPVDAKKGESLKGTWEFIDGVSYLKPEPSAADRP